MKISRKCGFSIFYIIVLIVINFFNYRLEDFLIDLTGKKFLFYLIYALFISFFVLLIFKVFPAKKNLDIALVLLTTALGRAKPIVSDAFWISVSSDITFYLLASKCLSAL